MTRALKPIANRSGMTLIESMFAILLTTVICASLWGVSNFVQRLKTQDSAQMLITDEARLTMEKILWGYKPVNDPNGQRDGIREADSFQILNNGTRLSYTDSTGAVREIRRTGNTIEYTEPGLVQWATLYAPPAGADATTTLLFKNSDTSADVVVVDLVIGRRIRERWFYASIEAKVLARN